MRAHKKQRCGQQAAPFPYPKLNPTDSPSQSWPWRWGAVRRPASGACVSWTAGASEDRSIEPDLCAGAEEAGLKKILRDGIMERKKSAPPYSEEHWKAARKFAREHNSVVKLR